MKFLHQFPASLFLLVANTLVFLFCYYEVKTFSEPTWTLNLLRMGAVFNPLTLDQEWYRLFTHLFLHGHVIHLAFNLYALFSIGPQLEKEIGTSKFVWVYFLCGVAAGLNSLYWSLFTIGVGASGAIFGLFGFSVMNSIFHARRQSLSISPILVNFAIFLIINLVFAKALRADNAAHFGGLGAGIVLAGLAHVTHTQRKVKFEYALVFILIGVYLLLPRFQVQYFKFFQKVLAIEDEARGLFEKEDLSNENYLQGFKGEQHKWDSALTMLTTIPFIPEELKEDTFKLRRYIGLRKQQADYRYKMIESESYIYLDSIEYAGEKIVPYLQLDYVLNMLQKPREQKEEAPQDVREPTRVWYDENWVEIPYPPAAYFRVGIRDSLNRWQGQVRDYYKSGEVQMKGSYLDDQRDGIFIYYSDHNTYESAGRYAKDRRVGKWESFHPNGKLESEVYYNDRYFLKSLWDSTGTQWVTEGNGAVKKYYTNGALAEEGEYKNGYQEGTWKGYHANGNPYYEEYYNEGRLVRGRSRNLQGQDFIYDASSFFPIPEGGFRKYQEYLQRETAAIASSTKGSVEISFRVTKDGVLTDIKVEKSLLPELDEKAKELVLNGPRWLPAHEHGFVVVDGFNRVVVMFN